MRLRLILILGVGLLGCSRTTDNKSRSNSSGSLATISPDSVSTPELDYESFFKFDSYLTENITSGKMDTVDFDCVILVYPTVEQIEEMKKTYGEDFYTVADDNQFYQGMAIEKIDSVGIRTTSANGQYLRLKGQEKTWDLDIRKNNLPHWNIVFFKTTKEPKIISAIELTTGEVRDYFEVREKTSR